MWYPLTQGLMQVHWLHCPCAVSMFMNDSQCEAENEDISKVKGGGCVSKNCDDRYLYLFCHDNYNNIKKNWVLIE